MVDRAGRCFFLTFKAPSLVVVLSLGSPAQPALSNAKSQHFLKEAVPVNKSEYPLPCYSELNQTKAQALLT